LARSLRYSQTMKTRSELPVIPEEDKGLLVELSNELFTHLLESKALSDPMEAQVIAAAFLVDSYEQGWRFTKCTEEEMEEESEETKEAQQSEDTTTGSQS